MVNEKSKQKEHPSVKVQKLDKPVQVEPGVSAVKRDAVDDVKALNKKLKDAQEANLELREKAVKDAEEKLKTAKIPVDKAKTIQPNMYSDATKTVENMEGVDIPKLIKSNEAGYYHLLRVNTEADIKAKKFEYVVRVVKLRVQGYESHKRSYAGAAEEEWIMFHNPTK